MGYKECPKAALVGLGMLVNDADNITEITRVYPKIQEAAELARTANVNLREVSNIIRRFKYEIRYDPERLSQIEDRLYIIEKLKTTSSSVNKLIKKMRDIKRIVLYVEGVFSKLKFKFLDIQQKGDHYAFFIFFKGSIAVLFLVGFFSIFLRDNLGPVTPIHAIVDQEIKVEKVIENSSTKYSEVFASGRLVAGLNIDALMSDSTGIGGSS